MKALNLTGIYIFEIMKILKISVLFLLLTFLVSKVYSQITFKSDRNFKYQSDSLLSTVGIGHADFSNVQFEVRYWINDLSGQYAHHLFILRMLKSGAWQLKRYQICYHYDAKKYEIVRQTDPVLTDWNNHWNQLLSYNILSLPDENKVRRTWRTEDGGVIAIGDGIYYHIELISKNHRRSYGYSNPVDNLKYYGIKYRELLDINKIIEILNKDFLVDVFKQTLCQ